MLGRSLQCLVGGLLAHMGKGGSRQFPAQCDEPIPVRFAQGPANGGLGLAGRSDLQPRGLRSLALGSNDVDGLAVLHPCPQRHAHPVHLRAHTGISDAGVNGIGEINGRRAARQLHHLAFGRETEHLVRIHLQLDGFEEILVILFAVELLGQLRNPLRRVHGKGVLRPHTIAIGPVGRHAGFGNVMHLPGADLHLDALAVAA